ncbi:protein kinase [Actinoplanes sp. NPDC051861]|uniref:serine/threonine-protein kinase n=1 Tax=Actinoplanes sp. NPDC051861 TaxID=3155170 RepID=UPI0034153171
MSSHVVLQAGLRLSDRYLLRTRLGAGGMGEVWLAVDEVLRRTVAVKVMLPGVAADPDFARRFEAEATAMARVNHPGVASIHDFGRSMGVAFLVMEFVDGESLAQRLARVGRLSPEETMRLVAQAADGLQAVHDQGLVHRDIKPANLLVRRDGTVVITDFGIARHEDASRLTVSGAILGTPSYLSPEQVRGEPAGVRSDVYALGLVAYECLAGEKPFTGDNPYAVALLRLQSSPRTIKIESPARAVVERALAMDPADRWPSASALAGAARTATAPAQAAFIPPSAPVPPGAPSKPPADHPGKSRRRMTLIAAVLVVTVASGAAVWIGSQDEKSSPNATPTPGDISEKSGTPGFEECDGGYCPTEPMCWGGLNSSNEIPAQPARKDCAGVHRWETFGAITLPPGAIRINESPLMDKPDIAAACSAEALRTRSQDADKTQDWVRDAWPIAVGGVPLLHCIVRSPDGESQGGVIKF